MSVDSLSPSSNLLVGTLKSIILGLKKLLGGKTRAVNFSTLIIVNHNNFVKALIFPAIGKELRSANATAILSQDPAKSSSTTQTQSVWTKNMNSKISIPS